MIIVHCILHLGVMNFFVNRLSHSFISKYISLVVDIKLLVNLMDLSIGFQSFEFRVQGCGTWVRVEREEFHCDTT